MGLSAVPLVFFESICDKPTLVSKSCAEFRCSAGIQPAPESTASMAALGSNLDSPQIFPLDKRRRKSETSPNQTIGGPYGLHITPGTG